MSEQIIARLEERLKALKERTDKLEANQRWAVIAILGLVVNAVFMTLTGGIFK